MEIPGWLQPVAYLAGDQWPTGDETALFRVGEDWRAAGRELTDLIPDLHRVRSRTAAALIGETAGALDQRLRAVLDGNSSVEKVADAMAALGDLAEQTGTDIEHTKMAILTALAVALAEIAWARAASAQTLGASLGVIPGIEALTSAAIRKLAAQLLGGIAKNLADADAKTGVLGDDRPHSAPTQPPAGRPRRAPTDTDDDNDGTLALSGPRVGAPPAGTPEAPSPGGAATTDDTAPRTGTETTEPRQNLTSPEPDGAGAPATTPAPDAGQSTAAPMPTGSNAATTAPTGPPISPHAPSAPTPAAPPAAASPVTEGHPGGPSAPAAPAVPPNTAPASAPATAPSSAPPATSAPDSASPSQSGAPTLAARAEVSAAPATTSTTLQPIAPAAGSTETGVPGPLSNATAGDAIRAPSGADTSARPPADVPRQAPAGDAARPTPPDTRPADTARPVADAGRPGETRPSLDPTPRPADTPVKPATEGGGGQSLSSKERPERRDWQHPDSGSPNTAPVIPPVYIVPVMPGLDPGSAGSRFQRRTTRAGRGGIPDVPRVWSPGAGLSSWTPRGTSAPEGPAGTGAGANHRQYGPRQLRPLEAAADQAAIENALREPGGDYTLGADPRTHPYGCLINGAGPNTLGRRNNCLDCGLAALALFFGEPTVAAPRFPDRLVDGVIDGRTGEADGLARAAAWLGAELQPADRQLPVPEQFSALHQQIAQLGPGSAALVVNEWRAHDCAGAPLSDPLGIPQLVGWHATVVVYPYTAVSPVWWDPQRGWASDHPLPSMVEDSASLWFTPLTPNHFGLTVPQ